MRQTGKRNGVPDREFFRAVFTFSQGSLLRYVESHPGLAQKLLEKSEDQRSTPSAYMSPRETGYDVGWYDYGYAQVQHHRRIEDAATDFVLAFWGLPRFRQEDRALSANA